MRVTRHYHSTRLCRRIAAVPSTEKSMRESTIRRLCAVPADAIRRVYYSVSCPIGATGVTALLPRKKEAAIFLIGRAICSKRCTR
jgi:hypothetical protein